MTDHGARISVFLGKGGVGRTTLASAFAVDRAAAGDRVLLVAVAATGNPFSRIQHEAAGVEAAGRLHLLQVETRALVDDLFRRITRLGAFADAITRHPSYDSLVSILPGVKQLALFHLIAAKRAEGYDRIVIDAPATGHGLHFLEAPSKAAGILAGKFRERAEELHAMLADPAITDVVLVTIPEEMPVREAIELAERLHAEGFTVDNVVVNKWLPSVFDDEGSRSVLQRLHDDEQARADFTRAIAGKTRVDVDAWLYALTHVAAQRRENLDHLDELRALNAKLSIVPLIPESSRRLAQIAEAMRAPHAEATL